MGANLLTVASVMTCPHGGTVVAIPNSPRASMGGAIVVYAADTFIIAGCPFIPVLPMPCVSVQWAQPAVSSAGPSAPTLTEDSVGFCLGAEGGVQGMVLIQATQSMVSGT
jgi:hypothetical protein